MPICVQIIEWVYNHMADGKKRESLRKIIDGKQVTVRYLDYDWSSNSKWLHVEKEILSIDIDSFSVTIDLLPLAFKASYKETMYFFNHVLQLVMFMCIIDWEREGKERERDRERRGEREGGKREREGGRVWEGWGTLKKWKQFTIAS